jgi:hypothetical protein
MMPIMEDELSAIEYMMTTDANTTPEYATITDIGPVTATLPSN